MIPSIPGNIVEWAAGGGGVALGIYICRGVVVVLKWVFDTMFARIDKKEETLDAGFAELMAEQKRQYAALSERFDQHIITSEAREQRRIERENALETRIHNLEDELRECEKKHAEATAEVQGLKAMIQGYGQARQLVTIEDAAERLGQRDGQTGA